ncbi:MAG: LIC_10190 family membrane protein, partial [Phycisphaerales bacterium]
MVQLLTAMLLILATWAVVAPSLIGIGLLVRRASGARSLDATQLSMCFWVGAAVATMLLQVWHVALPVDGRATGMLCAFGALGLALHAGPLLGVFRAAVRRPVALSLCIVGCLWLANRAAGPCDHPDSGLYQLQAVRWASEFPIVPGLANLNNNLGFNNSGALLAATMDVGFWYGRAAHLFNPALLAALLVQAVIEISRALRAQSGTELGLHLLGAAFLTPVVDLAISPHASSFTTDLGTSGMLFVAGAHALSALVRPKTEPAEARFDLLAIALLASCAVTWKLSAAGLSLCLFLLAAAAWWRGAHPGRAIALGVASAMSGLLV